MRNLYLTTQNDSLPSFLGHTGVEIFDEMNEKRRR